MEQTEETHPLHKARSVARPATNIKTSSRSGCPWWHTFLTLSDGKVCTGRPPRIQLLVVFHTQGDALLLREKAMPFS